MSCRVNFVFSFQRHWNSNVTIVFSFLKALITHMCIWFKTDCSRLCFPSAQKVSFPFQSVRFFITIKKSFFLQCYQVRQHKIMMTNKILPLLWLNLFGLITLFCGSLLVFLWCNCHFGTENIPGLQIPAPILRDCLPSDSSLRHGFTSSVSRSSTACLALVAPLGVGE